MKRVKECILGIVITVVIISVVVKILLDEEPKCSIELPDDDMDWDEAMYDEGWDEMYEDWDD